MAVDWLNPQDGRWYLRHVWYETKTGWVLEPTNHFGTDRVSYGEINITIKFRR